MKVTPKTPKTPKKRQKCKWKRQKWPSRPETYQAFSEWMAYPRSTRTPKTQGLFAKLHEISPDSLSDYKKKPEFWQKVEENKRKLKIQIADSLMLDRAVKEMEDKGNNIGTFL